jgi:serine/threonine protein kinase
VEKTISGTNGDYKIVQRIGSGGMGVVYRALSGDTSVAVKFIGNDMSAIDVTAAERLKIEAHSLYQIKHPNVVKILDYGVYDTRAFLVMEHLKGASLDNLLTKTLPWGTIREIMLQTCDAVAAAHERGIIHRDIKPPNIFLLDDPNRVFIKIIDFGTAKVVGDAMFSTLTRTGHVVGTLQYMAPEMLEGTPPIAGLLPRVDVYSTGAVMYHLLSGRIPFDHPNIAALMNKILSEAAIPLSERVPERGIPPELDEVVLRAIAKDPYDRFSTMLELKEAIAAIDWDGIPYRKSNVARNLFKAGLTLAIVGGVGFAGWHYQKEIISFYNNTIHPAYDTQAVPYLKQHNLPHPELPGFKTPPATGPTVTKPTAAMPVPAQVPAPKAAPAPIQKEKRRAPSRAHSPLVEGSVPDTESTSVEAADTAKPAPDTSGF